MPDNYGNRRPGEPGYNAGYREGFRKPGGSHDNVNGLPGQQSNEHDVRTPGGHYDPARDGAYGNQAGYGDGSKFQNDFQQGHLQAYNSLMGSYSPNQPGVGAGVGMIGTGVNGTSQSEGSNAAQMQLIQQLQAQADGSGPSLAQMQLQKGTDQNMAQAMALGAAQRGAGQGGMLKGIANQQASIGQGMANDSAMLRLQEQMQARGQLGQQIGQQQQNNQFNTGQVNQMNVSRQQAGMDAERLRQETQLAYEKMRQQQAEKNSPAGMLGGMFGMLGKM